ncbi:hypothetical protein P8605_48940, partial [Streptomyces sp. T-3]|nr:hypothetical protein [Streptomyces sp. T-3]
PPFGQPFPPGGPFPPPPPRGGANTALIVGICATLGLALVGLIAAGIFLDWFGSDSSDNQGSSSAGPGISAAPSYSTDPGVDSDSSGGSSTGGGSTTAASDPTEDAFKAVQSGTCLAVWDTGYGGTSTVKWSHETPPDPIDCDSDKANVQVTSVDGSCSGDTEATWSYSSTTTGKTTQLCLERIFHKNYCFLATQSGSKITDMGEMTLVDCKAKKIPASYDQIMHITGVYNTSKGTDASLCRRVQGDQTEYWAWTVNDGDTLLCTMVYRG